HDRELGRMRTATSDAGNPKRTAVAVPVMRDAGAACPFVFADAMPSPCTFSTPRRELAEAVRRFTKGLVLLAEDESYQRPAAPGRLEEARPGHRRDSGLPRHPPREAVVVLIA